MKLFTAYPSELFVCHQRVRDILLVVFKHSRQHPGILDARVAHFWERAPFSTGIAVEVDGIALEKVISDLQGVGRQGASFGFRLKRFM